ncbi:hypothetical protein F2Q68_00014087 [Brassica cretica]|uniref:TPX2 C-terminal domain-containing protein n=1 Tax=Brassica cretica TaxID=69181 RepID=A0A8S9HNI4_BRACR|nr:hypothetical protein F2Q68_00014087 [Brassica cretica]
MGDMQVGVANIDDKGFYGMMEDKPGASSNPTLQVSVSFGRFENDSLSWEKFSAFSPNKYLEEVGKCATPGSVAQKKAYFEAHYKKIAERKAEIMDQEKLMDDKKASFRSVVTDQWSMGGEVGGSVTESVVDTEEDKHVTDIAAEVKELSVNVETIIVKECQSSVDEVKEEVKNSLDSPRLEKPEEEVLLMDEKEETEVRENVDTTANTNETPMKEMEKEKTQKLIKKGGNVGINRTRNSPKPDQVKTKPATNKIVTSKKTPPSKEIKNMVKPTKKPAAPVSKAPPGFSTPRVYKPASKCLPLPNSHADNKNKRWIWKDLRKMLNPVGRKQLEPMLQSYRKVVGDELSERMVYELRFSLFVGFGLLDEFSDRSMKLSDDEDKAMKKTRWGFWSTVVEDGCSLRCGSGEANRGSPAVEKVKRFGGTCYPRCEVKHM